MKKALCRKFYRLAGSVRLPGGPGLSPTRYAVPKTWAAMPLDAANDWPNSDWWTGFGSTQLDGLMQQAMAGNLDIAAAMARIEMANGQARQAGAALLPSIGAGVGGGETRQLSMLGHERHHIFDEGVLQASYELDFWGKNRSAAAGRRKHRGCGKIQRRQLVRIATAASVATTYISLLGLQDQLKILQTNLQAGTRHARRHDQHAASRHDPGPGCCPAAQSVDSLAATLPPLVQQIEHLHTALAILVGVLPENLHLQPESLDGLNMPAVIAGLPSGCSCAGQTCRWRKRSLKPPTPMFAWHRLIFIPSFDLTASGGIESYTLTNFTVPPLGIYTLASSITQPLFHGGYLQGQSSTPKAPTSWPPEDYRKDGPLSLWRC